MQDQRCSTRPEGASQSDGTPGWDAINDSLAALYPGQEPRHFGAALPWTLGGDNPLDGISVYWSALPRPHWHYVTYGISELYDKQSDDPQTSGFGFELSFRLAAEPGMTALDPPPAWPMNLLQNLARYVFESGNVFEQGHHMNANGPIALERDTQLRQLAFMRDPQLPPRSTVNGHLEFLQVIGLTDGEMDAIQRWSAESLLDVLEPVMPLWITDLARGDLLDDLDVARSVEQGSQRDSSSTAALFVDALDWQVLEDGPVQLMLGAGQVTPLLRLLPARLPFGRALELVGRERGWVFMPGEQDDVRVEGMTAICTLQPASLQSLLRQLQPQRGRYPVGDGQVLVLQVRPTVLRDAKGVEIGTLG